MGGIEPTNAGCLPVHRRQAVRSGHDQHLHREAALVPAALFTSLDENERLRLLRFVCSFAWADLRVEEAERRFILKLVSQFQLPDDERAQVEEWLRIPPRPEDVDPTDIPAEHRQIFLDYALQVVGADGQLSEQEIEALRLFETLLPT